MTENENMQKKQECVCVCVLDSFMFFGLQLIFDLQIRINMYDKGIQYESYLQHSLHGCGLKLKV